MAKFLHNERNNFERQLLVNINNKYELIIKTLINYTLTINFKDEKIVSEWENIIYKLIREVIYNLLPCSKYLNDSLDINNYIKIKIIPYKDTSMCKVIKGYVLHNRKKSSNVKEYFEYPRILLLNNEIKENEKENENDNDKDHDNDKNNENDKEKNNNSINQDEQLYLLKLI